MKLSCPYCGDSIKYEESLAGKNVTCSYCKRPVLMPSVAQLPPDYQEEFRQEKEKLRKNAESAERKKLFAQQKESERKQAEFLRKQELENRAKEAQAQQKAEADRQQQYVKAIADVKSDPDKPKIWYCKIKGTQHGPMQEVILQKWADDGTVGKDDYVRVEGAVIWIRLSDIPERIHVPLHAVDVSVRCPKCGCTQLSTEKKGMSGEDACCGALLLGPLGLLCGLQGANKVIVTCLKCGHQWSKG
jgi:hypothetical protein